MSLDGIEAASNYKAISLVAFVWLKIIKKEKKSEGRWTHLKVQRLCWTHLKKQILRISHLPVYRNKVWIVKQDGKISSLQAAMLQRRALLLTVGEQVEIVIFVVMEGITFIARSLGIRKNIILGFFFLVTKEKEGGNSPRNKDPGSLWKDLSQLWLFLLGYLWTPEGQRLWDERYTIMLFMWSVF